jgi:hypothetical protein
MTREIVVTETPDLFAMHCSVVRELSERRKTSASTLCLEDESNFTLSDFSEFDADFFDLFFKTIVCAGNRQLRR